jgi:hypothetical protein
MSQHRAAQLEADLHHARAKDAERALKFADLLVSRIRCSISASNLSEVLPEERHIIAVDPIPVFSDSGKAFSVHLRLSCQLNPTFQYCAT